jgi:lipoprotein-anchoring transpeptidase ErfK/SrfK
LEAERGKKWIDVSLAQQTLVLYEGKTARYATLISSGQDRLGDPDTQKATPRGHFRIQSKHIAAAMDSEENSSVSGGKKTGRHLGLSAEHQATVARLLRAEKQGRTLSSEDQRRLKNVHAGRHPEYGVTRRRGASTFELRDVPWIQYFESGFALHGAYWHDVFGIPRSHGCINLSPIDARFVFRWTEPAVPDGWHGINVSPELGEGTAVVIRE